MLYIDGLKGIEVWYGVPEFHLEWRFKFLCDGGISDTVTLAVL
jgi:hypothetical protein